MTHASTASLLVVHTLRVLGHSSAAQVAALRSLPLEVVEEELEDARAMGTVARSSFGGSTTWHVTDRGRAKGEAALAAELAETGARPVVEEAHADFLPLNRRIGPVVTQWQLRPTPQDPLAPNDHLDPAHDDAVVRRLGRLVDDLAPVLERLTGVLTRFDLHRPRLEAALRRVERGENSWVDAPEVASLNICWIQLHEDLLATLGIERGSDDPAEGR